MLLKLDHMIPPSYPINLNSTESPYHKYFHNYLVTLEHASDADVALCGIPYDGGAIFKVGTSLGPKQIRKKGVALLRTFSIEQELDIKDYIRVIDIGDLEVVQDDIEETLLRIDELIKTLSRAKLIPLILGGDHSVTYQTAKSFIMEKKKRVGIIWFDNHLDTMSNFKGKKIFCGTPLFHIINELSDYVHPENVVHIGSRGFDTSFSEWKNARDLGIHIIKAEEVHIKGIQFITDEAIRIAKKNTSHLYLSFDIDVTEGIIAPGCQCPRTGGLFPWQLLYAVRNISKSGVDIFDLMEVAPPMDVRDSTVQLAASLILEFLLGQAMRKANVNI